MKILITGANGFVGKNLLVGLKQAGYNSADLLCYDVDNTEEQLADWVRQADFVVHLAGVNRPKNVDEFKTGNVDLTKRLCDMLLAGKKSPILISSSIQVVLDNPYGASKLGAEMALEEYADKGGTAIVFRLPNVFGKWCRPNYNSAVATFCYNISHDLPITINNRDSEVWLVYVDDVVTSIVDSIAFQWKRGCYRKEVEPVLHTTVGELADRIYEIRANRETKVLPDLSDYLTKCLYSTYLSYLDEDNFVYQLDAKHDVRGWLAELIKSKQFGQMFVSVTKPGITRGNHYHNSKVEKFIVISGSGVIRLRYIRSDDVIEYKVSGEKLQVVDIPPGFTHSIENTGDCDLITLFWANEMFDPNKTDTYFEKV